MNRFLVAVILLVAAPASADPYFSGTLTGSAKLIGRSATLPDTLVITTSYTRYFASEDLPQIGDDLFNYSLFFQSVGMPIDPLSPNVRAYDVTGGVIHNGEIVQALIPGTVSIRVGDPSAPLEFSKGLFFNQPIQGIVNLIDFFGWINAGFRASISYLGSGQAAVSGFLEPPIYIVTSEPAALAMFGLGALALRFARRGA